VLESEVLKEREKGKGDERRKERKKEEGITFYVDEVLDETGKPPWRKQARDLNNHGDDSPGFRTKTIRAPGTSA